MKVQSRYPKQIEENTEFLAEKKEQKESDRQTK